MVRSLASHLGVATRVRHNRGVLSSAKNAVELAEIDGQDGAHRMPLNVGRLPVRYQTPRHVGILSAAEGVRVVQLCRATATIALGVLAAVALPGCSDPDKAVGGRLTELQKVVEAMKGKPEGRYSAADMPADVRPRGLLKVYVDGRGAYALEFMSEVTIDLNPAFVFVGFDAPDQEAAAREVCGKAALIYRNAFKEPGWHRATGQ